MKSYIAFFHFVICFATPLKKESGVSFPLNNNWTYVLFMQVLKE